uniref:putative B3 domain-containing protein Os04g0346900 n=1 Tax=Erigeron canadensis TaxID=72917 RepID=UPI001CB92FAD|nr:putative B3 domain-containing protein Os04g0346900 [Erigeron canadensis]
MAHRRPPSLFWITLLDPSSAELRIPSTAATKYFNNEVPKDPITLSANGGYSWEIKVEKFGEGLWFANGWMNVVQDAQFHFGEMLLFKIVDHPCIGSIKMSVYSSNGCERSLQLPPVEADVLVLDDDDDDPFFISVISRSHNTMLRLPRDFVRLAKIEDKETVILKGLGGHEWLMGVGLDRGNPTARYFLSSGWLDFKRSNNLSEGDTCVFKFLRSENKMWLQKVTKRPFSQNPTTTQTPKNNRGGSSVVKQQADVAVAKRPRGRPRKQQHGTAPP